MTIDRRSPVPILGRVSTFGPSLHGRVHGGTLTLDNGATVAHMQPIGRAGMPWTASSTYYVRRPGWTPGPIASSVRDALAAQGRELLDYAILAGQDTMYAKKSRDGGWLVFDDDGRCWTYRLAGRSGPNTARVFDVRRRRMGLVDGSGLQAETIMTTAPIDMGQSGAPDYYYNNDEDFPPPGSLVLLPDTYNPAPILVSTTPDGRRSLWMLPVRSNGPSGQGWRSYIDHPVGFFELVVAAEGSVTAQLVKSRADCMGAYTSSSTTTSPGGVASMVIRSVTSGGESCGVDGSRSFGIWEAVTDVELGPAVRSNEYWPGVTAAQDWTGIVLAMWYDTAGVLRTITADIEHRFERDTAAGYAGVPSAVDYRGACSDGSSGETWAGTVSLAHTVDYNISERTTLTIRDNGAAVPGLSHTIERNITAAQAIGLQWFPPTAATGSQTATIDGTLKLDGVIISSVSRDVSADWEQRNADTFQRSSAGFLPVTYRRSPAMIMPVWQSPPQTGGGDAAIEPVRWANHAIGLRTARSPAAATWRDSYGPVTTPGGVIAHAFISGDYPHGTRYALSGSWRPVRQEFAASISIDDGVTPHLPVCWV